MRRWIPVLAALAVPAWGSELALSFVDDDGKTVAIRPEPAAGQAFLLHFWATWCPECAEDLAGLGDAAAGCDRVRVVAVNAGDSEAQVEAYLARHPLRLRVLRDPGGEVWRRQGGGGLPMNVYWSARGRETELGPKTREQWRERLASLGCPSTAR